MLSRSRAQVPDAAVEERVGRLLLRPPVPGGWVPPASGVDLPETSWSAWETEPAAPAEVEQERSWSPREPEPVTDDDAVKGATRRLRVLPATLAGGRLDPGHRGAIALLLVCLLAAAIAAGVVLRARPQEVQVPVVEQVGTELPGVASPSPVATPAATEVVVAVAGEVVTPGVVRLPAGSRVDDALRAAGGLAPGGSAGLLNLARVLVDGEQVVVGPQAQPDPAAAGGSSAGAAGGLVDLNAADASALDELPGIGPVLAERIVEWRTENGSFASVDQLREVPGIGEAKYASLKNKVTV